MAPILAPWRRRREGRTQHFTMVLSVDDPTTVRLRLGVHLAMAFGAGHTSYAEGILQVQSLVHHVPPPAEESLSESSRERDLLRRRQRELHGERLGRR